MVHVEVTSRKEFSPIVVKSMNKVQGPSAISRTPNQPLLASPKI